MTLSRALVRAWMVGAQRAIPHDALETTRLHLLDLAGVGLAAATLTQGAPYRRLAQEMRAAQGVATLAGAPVADAATAALIDGGLMHALEYDDTHTGSIVHGGAVIAPAALALAAEIGATPERAVRACLFGYEAFIRLGLAAPGAFQRHGFQVTSIAGPLVAALIACDLMECDEDARVNAIGVALSQSSGVFEFLSNGSTVKSMHPGWAAHAGLLAARLARAGLTGPETAIEGARGLYASYAHDADAPARLAALLDDVGARWRIAEVAFKFAPCCHYLHPFIEATNELAAQFVVDDIESIDLRIAPGAAPIVCEPWAEKLAARDGHAMRWSLPLVVATRFVDGRLDHDTFARAPSADAQMLAARCRWAPLEPNRFPKAFEAEIACRLRDGRIVMRRVDDAYGNASRPATRADVIAKFRANAGRALDDAGVAALQSFFLEEAAPDFAPYARALARRLPGAPS